MSAQTTSQSISSRTQDWVRLTKPGIVVTNVMMAAVGLWLAPGLVTPETALGVLLGTGLLVAACGAFNQFLERETDALMPRTSTRPLPAGRCEPGEALAIGALGIASGICLLAVLTNLLTTLLGIAAVVIYVAFYTPMKRWTVWSIPVGAVAGALPPVMGWAAATGEVGAGALGLFAILFLWQIPHFLGIALFRVDHYESAGLKVGLGTVDTDVTIALVRAASIELVLVGAAFVWWTESSLLFAAFVLVAVGAPALQSLLPVTRTSIPQWGRRVFFASLVTLPVLTLGALVEVFFR